MGFIALSSAADGLLMIFQLLALLAVVAAIQSFFSGLILETFRQKDRQDFEMELARIQAQYTDLTDERQHHAKPHRERRTHA